MDKVEGPNLANHSIINTISEADGLRICSRVVLTLAVSEDMGIMHQDIKPENY